MIQILCDHCLKEVEQDKLRLVPIAIGGYVTEAELCGICQGELITKVERFINGEVEK